LSTITCPRHWWRWAIFFGKEKKKQNKAKKKGYKDAYIVAFYQKKRITVEKAKQLEK